MNVILQNLLTLQTLEFGEVTGEESAARVAELRAVIPPTFLGHYDRLRARGKKGLASVRNQVCTGCHMRVPIGLLTALMRDEDVQLCDSCGRYLYYLPEPAAETSAPEPVKPIKVVKSRKRKALEPAA